MPIPAINHLSPDRMTPEQRCREIAALLVRGLVRLRQAGQPQTTNLDWESQFGLAFAGQESVHSEPVKQRKPEFR